MKNRFYVGILFWMSATLGMAQNPKPYTQMADMPIPMTNNAVCGVVVDGKEYVYSFGGLGQGKTHEDITLRSFKYDVQADVWSEIEALPDTMGKIAAAASVVNGKIYIVGGYYVFPDGHEKSSPNVHVYDPKADRFLPDAANIPTPIDDQIQAVWQDSLLYIAAGWSDSLNVRKVQVFNPHINSWAYATPLPSEYSYAIFGSSGVIGQNTLYYVGGAGNRQNKNFPIQSTLRRGQINPENPLTIKWSSKPLEGAGIYRSASFLLNSRPAWINGASLSYNYNGIAYTGSPVEPLHQIIRYDPLEKSLAKTSISVPPVMDLRGVGVFDNKLIIAGGMLPGQKVSQSTFIVYTK